MSQSELAASFAIFAAKQEGSAEVTPDHILLGCLRAISRFGIATIGPWDLDLEALGVDWTRQLEGPAPKVAYSAAAVELFDRAARIAGSRMAGPEGKRLGLADLLAAFAGEEQGLMGQLKRTYGATNASWRAAISRIEDASTEDAGRSANGGPSGSTRAGEREYLTPEEAAEALGIHVQTMRGYIRSERVPAFRLAGERAIRILRSDLEKVLEPLKGER